MNSHLLREVSTSLKGFVLSLPTPSSISYLWNCGSLLGSCLVIQILTGFFLSLHYSSSLSSAFESVLNLEEVWLGWGVRFIHANGASLFFILIYFHISRGLYYSSFLLKESWLVGVTLLFLLMGSAFLGYVLPWGQMSFWGATVITNLLSSLPYGEELVMWVWGGYSVGGPTLTRFFSLHFILPFVMMVVVVVHLSFLHKSGSSNPLGLEMNSEKVSFHPLFTWKDLLGFVMLSCLLLALVVVYPDLFMDPDNFSPANPLSTPEHIQPEWYFLFAYAILRSIPNKLGGVVGLVLAVAALAFLPFLGDGKGCQFSPTKEILFWVFAFSFLLLTWLGSMPAEGIFIPTSQLVSMVYFTSLLLLVAA